MNIKKITELLGDFLGDPDAKIGTKWGDLKEIRRAFSKHNTIRILDLSHVMVLSIHAVEVFHLLCSLYRPTTIRKAITSLDRLKHISYSGKEGKCLFTASYIKTLGLLAEIAESNGITLTIGNNTPLTAEIGQPKLKLIIAPRMEE